MEILERLSLDVETRNLSLRLYGRKKGGTPIWGLECISGDDNNGGEDLRRTPFSMVSEVYIKLSCSYGLPHLDMSGT